MSKLYCLGELLIDFQSVGTASLKDTRQFVKNAGGAPANVCVQAVKLGRQAAYLSMVGADGFGDFLVETLNAEGVDTSHVRRTDKYDTSLAFVSFKENGEREFSFYRRAAADLHFSPDDFKDVSFAAGDVFEFGSVAVKTDIAAETHRYLIKKAKEAGALVCFDPNLRFNLWESAGSLKAAVKEFLPYADVVKAGADELQFITGKSGDEGVRELLSAGVKLLLVTDGANGAKLYTDKEHCVCGGYKVKAADTTGAGDSFFGAFISCLMEQNALPENVNSLGREELEKMLCFACRCGAYTTTGYGAIPAMGDKLTVDKAVK